MVRLGKGKEWCCRSKEAFTSFLPYSRRDKNIGFLKSHSNRQVEILNSFSFGYSNGFLEGINNQTKVMKRNAYDFRRFDHFRAKILLNLKYKEIGVHLG